MNSKFITRAKHSLGRKKSTSFSYLEYSLTEKIELIYRRFSLPNNVNQMKQISIIFGNSLSLKIIVQLKSIMIRWMIRGEWKSSLIDRISPTNFLKLWINQSFSFDKKNSIEHENSSRMFDCWKFELQCYLHRTVSNVH